MPRPRGDEFSTTLFTGTSGTIGSTTIALFGGDDDDATSSSGSSPSSGSDSMEDDVKGLSTTTLGLIIAFTITAALAIGWLAVHHYRKRKRLGAVKTEATAEAAKTDERYR